MSNSTDMVKVSVPVPSGDTVRERQAMRFLRVLDSVLQTKSGASVDSVTIVELTSAGATQLSVPRKAKRSAT